MRANRSVFLGLAFVLSCSQAAISQETTSVSSPTSGPKSGGHAVDRRDDGPRVVTGSPYSATLTTTHAQTLADGTHVQGPDNISRSFRDSQGRTRVDHFMPSSLSKDPDNPTLISAIITDPVAGFTYHLDATNHRATRWPYAAGAVRSELHALNSVTVETPTMREGASDRPRSTSTSEPLGTQSFDGVVAVGTRTTLTLPVGARGNDRPINIVAESWYSGDLRMVVAANSENPMTGTTSTHLTQLDRNEPDPALFEIPDGYAIEDLQPGRHGAVAGIVE